MTCAITVIDISKKEHFHEPAGIRSYHDRYPQDKTGVMQTSRLSIITRSRALETPSDCSSNQQIVDGSWAAGGDMRGISLLGAADWRSRRIVGCYWSNQRKMGAASQMDPVWLPPVSSADERMYAA